MTENSTLLKGQKVSVSLPPIYSESFKFKIGDIGEITGKPLKSIKDCKDEAVALQKRKEKAYKNLAKVLLN